MGLMLVLHHNAFSQEFLNDPKAKTVLKEILGSREDSNRVKAYLEYAFLWENQNLDSAESWYLKAGALSDKINYPLGQLKFRSNYTYVLNQKGDYAESVKRNQECLSIARKYPQLQYVNKSLANLGTSYYYLGKYEESIQFLQQAANGFQRDGQNVMVPAIYSRMGQVMSNAGLSERAFPYNLKALQMQRELPPDTIKLIETLNGVFINLSSLNRFQEALPYILEARSLSEAIHSKAYIEQSYSFLGNVFRKLGQYDSSLKYNLLAYKLVRNSNNVFLKMSVLRGLAMHYFTLKDYSKEEFYTREAIQLGEAENLYSDLLSFYQELGKIEARKKNFKSAFELMLKYQNIYDSVQGQSVKTQVQELDAKYQAVQNEKKILVLEKEKDKQQSMIVGLAVGFFVILCIGLLVYRNISIRKKIAEKEVIQLQQERQLLATNSVLKGQDEERSRLAKDLHDGLGGMLSGLKFSLNNMKGNMILDEKNAIVFQKSIGQLDNVIAEMRRVAHSMMPEALVRLGLIEASQDLCDEVAKTSGLNVHFQSIGLEVGLEQSVSVALYRMEQELLNNIIKHAEATEILVQLVKDESQISLTVEDNGKGFEIDHVKQGFGLSSIRNRVEALGGRLNIQSSPESGTSVLIEITL